MNDLIGPNLRKWPFEVIWQEDDNWNDSWAARQFARREEAEKFYCEVGQRPAHRAWIGEVGRYTDHGITREAYFYYGAKNIGQDYAHLSEDLGKPGRGLMWFNDEESEDATGNFALVDYTPIDKERG